MVKQVNFTPQNKSDIAPYRGTLSTLVEIISKMRPAGSFLCRRVAGESDDCLNMASADGEICFDVTYNERGGVVFDDYHRAAMFLRLHSEPFKPRQRGHRHAG